MTHGSLFSGIGGFDLAAEWMGWENVFHCEINEFCLKVINYYWPDSEIYRDIKLFNATKFKNIIDVLSGGWPCQKYSIAGSKAGEEPLKDEFVRIIREIEAPWLCLENVGNFIGKQFAKEHDELCLQLEDMGYETQTFDIDAASCGLPTVERHIWIVATSDSFRQKRIIPKAFQNVKTQQREFQGSYQREAFRWDVPESRVCQLGEGISYKLDGITVSKWHGEMIQATGNAIPPQVAYEIFKAIEQFEKVT
ncbi:MAG TPA: DNA cytosine methyltransferase [Puia sp.]|jgi:DNA (cytosine-5)-methyltransferase 1|nr:DNA cytosine methyltransferase [Puia sp.]